MAKPAAAAAKALLRNSRRVTTMHAPTTQPSNMPEAGNGRFAAEILGAGSEVAHKPVVPMAKIDSLVTLSNDVVISFVDTAELEKYIDLSKSEGDYSRQQILDMFQHNVYG